MFWSRTIFPSVLSFISINCSIFMYSKERKKRYSALLESEMFQTESLSTLLRDLASPFQKRFCISSSPWESARRDLASVKAASTQITYYISKIGFVDLQTIPFYSCQRKRSSRQKLFYLGTVSEVPANPAQCFAPIQYAQSGMPAACRRLARVTQIRV